MKARKTSQGVGFYIIAILLVAVIAFSAGIIVSGLKPVYSGEAGTNYAVFQPDRTGYSEAKMAISGNNLSFTTGCRELSMLITEDQAFSIAAGAAGHYVRPLPHDLMQDMIDNMGATVVEGRIDESIDGIHRAKIILQWKDNVLDVDSRPSDMAALSVRMGNPVYVSNEVMNAYGSRVC